MSVIAKALNAYLRWSEKRRILRAFDTQAFRRSFAFRARLFFHGPMGSRYVWDKAGKVPVQWAMAKGVAQDGNPVILYLHGGGYAYGSTDTHKAMLARLSQFSGLPACLVEYRLAPEHPFPAALEDAMAAYKALSDRRLILGGDSAGGGLALGLLAEVLQRDLPRPVSAFCFSPLTDLTFSGDSVTENADAEVMIPVERLGDVPQNYLKGVRPEDWRASPLFADFEGAPPVWLTVGSTEVLRDDTTRLAEKLRAQGVDVTMKLEHDLPHVWPIFHNVLPEARATLTALANWLRTQTD